MTQSLTCTFRLAGSSSSSDEITIARIFLGGATTGDDEVDYVEESRLLVYRNDIKYIHTIGDPWLVLRTFWLGNRVAQDDSSTATRCIVRIISQSNYGLTFPPLWRRDLSGRGTKEGSELANFPYKSAT